VALDAGSKWIVDRTSYITSLTIDKSASVMAPEGYSVIMTVDGVNAPIKAGDYKGQIVLKVSKNA
jgi:hypothetical protein